MKTISSVSKLFLVALFSALTFFYQPLLAQSSASPNSIESNVESNSNGDIDTSFNASVLGGAGYVNATVVQPDGKILIGGSFNEVNGESRHFVARLNSDGSVDTTFAVGAGANGIVRAIALQSDGTILIGGFFTEYNDIMLNRMTRLNTDGSLDTSFNIGKGAYSTVETLALQPDGKILVGGTFTTFNGTARNRVTRLNPNGSVDTSFNVGIGASNTVYTFAIQSDGKILVGGSFATFNGVSSYPRLVRLNSDGSTDTTFTNGFKPRNSSVEVR